MAEVARIVTVNRNYGLVITAAGRYVSSETYLTVYYIEYISLIRNMVPKNNSNIGNLGGVGGWCRPRLPW